MGSGGSFGLIRQNPVLCGYPRPCLMEREVDNMKYDIMKDHCAFEEDLQSLLNSADKGRVVIYHNGARASDLHSFETLDAAMCAGIREFGEGQFTAPVVAPQEATRLCMVI